MISNSDTMSLTPRLKLQIISPTIQLLTKQSYQKLVKPQIHSCFSDSLKILQVFVLQLLLSFILEIKCAAMYVPLTSHLLIIYALAVTLLHI